MNKQTILRSGTSLGGVSGAFADEDTSKNSEISDSDRKMDALMDMIADACSKMDEGGKRMDAMEENFRRMDARMDAVAAKDSDDDKDEDGDKKADSDDDEKGDPKEIAADKGRKDSDDDKDDKKADARKDEDEMDRKDEDKKEEKEEAAADTSQFMTRADAESLRAQIVALQSRSPAIVSDADRERFASIQEQADPAFQAFGDRAPGPLDGETPMAYKRRLGGKLQAHSPKWKDAKLNAVADDAMLDTILGDVYADSMTAARQGNAVPQGQLREISRQSGGHIINEFFGDSSSWTNQFAGNSQRAVGNFQIPGRTH